MKIYTLRALVAAAVIVTAGSLTACTNSDFRTSSSVPAIESESTVAASSASSEKDAVPAELNPLAGQYADSSADSSYSSNSSSSTGGYASGETTSNVNMRSEPQGSPIGTVPKGVTVDVIAKSGNWFEIIYGDMVGYVYKDYITVTGDVPDAASGDETDTGGNAAYGTTDETDTNADNGGTADGTD